MKKVSELVRFLKDPHSKKVQYYKERYQELDDLSQEAVEMGDVIAYRSIEVEMREVFFDYLTAVVVDSIYRLVPYVLIIWIISLKWPTITIPFANRQVDVFGAFLVSYLLYHVGKGLVKPIKSKLCKLGLFGLVRASKVSKL